MIVGYLATVPTSADAVLLHYHILFCACISPSFVLFVCIEPASRSGSYRLHMV